MIITVSGSLKMRRKAFFSDEIGCRRRKWPVAYRQYAEML
jgi:hypothetical protein